MADSQAFTSTPDLIAGAPIAVVVVTNASSQIVSQEIVVIGDKTDGTLHAGESARGVAVQVGTVTVAQGAVGTTNWVVNAAQGAVGTTAWLFAGRVAVAGRVNAGRAAREGVV